MPVKVLSNQENKQPGTTNNALKMQRVLFHRSHDIKNKLPFIIHADKMSVQEETNFSQTKPRVFLLKPFTLKPIKIDGHLLTYLHQMTNIANIVISFLRKNQRVARFQKQIILSLHQSNFCFQNARSRFQDSF